MIQNQNKPAIVVLGASPKADRYSHKAVALLIEHGYNVIPVNLSGAEVCGLNSLRSLSEILCETNTLTVYVKPSRSDLMKDEILALNPKRIIFNPGAENAELQKVCVENGIETLEVCTLLLLKTGQF